MTIFSDNPHDRRIERFMTAIPNIKPRGVGVRFSESQVLITITAATPTEILAEAMRQIRCPPFRKRFNEYRIDEETIQLQEAALALHKAKQRMEIGSVEYASRVKEYSERMKELEAERNELQGTAAKYAEVRLWLDTFIEQTMQSDTLTTVDGTTMKMLVDRIHVRNDGIVVEFKCGVAIEQEYVK